VSNQTRENFHVARVTTARWPWLSSFHNARGCHKSRGLSGKTISRLSLGRWRLGAVGYLSNPEDSHGVSWGVLKDQFLPQANWVFKSPGCGEDFTSRRVSAKHPQGLLRGNSPQSRGGRLIDSKHIRAYRSADHCMCHGTLPNSLHYLWLIVSGFGSESVDFPDPRRCSLYIGGNSHDRQCCEPVE